MVNEAFNWNKRALIAQRHMHAKLTKKVRNSLVQKNTAKKSLSTQGYNMRDKNTQ